MKAKLFLLITVILCATAQAAPSDSERLAALERQVARLTEQVNQLLAERLDKSRFNKNEPVYVCSIKAFTDTYRSENVSRGKARLDVLQQCRNNHNAMFCEESAVECKTYQ